MLVMYLHGPFQLLILDGVVHRLQNKEKHKNEYNKECDSIECYISQIYSVYDAGVQYVTELLLM